MFTISDMTSWCTICGRERNRHGACINLFCQQQEAAMHQARGYVSEVDHEVGSVVVSSEHHAGPASPPPSTRARVARTRPRRIWRGIDGGQSVVVQQVMGQMWGTWQRWGDVLDQTGS